MPLFPIAEPQAAAVGDDPEPDENRLHLESEVQPIAERANEGGTFFVKLWWCYLQVEQTIQATG